MLQKLNYKQIAIFLAIGVLFVSGFSIHFASAEDPAAQSSSVNILSRDLERGMKGSDVVLLQTWLAKDKAIYPEGLITGYFGSLTEEAVKRYQEANGIVKRGDPRTTGYGRVGPITRASLNSAFSGTGKVYGVQKEKGKIEQGLFFNGGYMEASSTQALSFRDNSDITLEAWINPSTLTWRKAIVVGKGSYGSLWNYGIGIEQKGKIFARHSQGDIVSTKAYVKAGEWQHIAVVYSGGIDYFYYNGKLVDKKADKGFNELPNPQPLRVGISFNIRTQGLEDAFLGGIDELKIYNNAQSAQDILDSFQGKQLPENNFQESVSVAEPVIQFGFDGESLGMVQTDNTKQTENTVKAEVRVPGVEASTAAQSIGLENKNTQAPQSQEQEEPGQLEEKTATSTAAMEHETHNTKQATSTEATSTMSIPAKATSTSTAATSTEATSETATSTESVQQDEMHNTEEQDASSEDGSTDTISATTTTSTSEEQKDSTFTSQETGGSGSGTNDIIAPAAITNLSASNPTTSSIRLSWTATGDDSKDGTAASYDVRYSTSPISESNWSSSTQVSGEPTPSVTGSSESMTVSGLSPGVTYYFAIKAIDEAGNASGLSNVASQTTQGIQDCSSSVASGAQTYFVRTQNQPQIMQIDINPLNVQPANSQSVTVKIRDTNNNEITTVSGTVQLDHGSQSFSLELISGTTLNGTWQGTWSLQDGYCTNYMLTIMAVSASGSSKVDLAFK